VLLYHLVFPAKYRRAVFDEKVDVCVKEVCLEIEQRYEITFLEIGVDKDNVHFLVQSVPMDSVACVRAGYGFERSGRIPDIAMPLSWQNC
jgi:REP element-mobilizing transposase RayT